MLKRSCDIMMVTSYGFFKTSFLLSFVCLSALLFLKMKSISRLKLRSIEPVGILVSPEERMKTRKTYSQENKELKTSEVEIFKLILRLSDEIPPSDARKLAKFIGEECENYELDPFLILAMIQVESRFDPMAVSHRGAIGLMQVMPGTAHSIAEELGISIIAGKSLYDPLINVRLGIYYFSLLTVRFESIHDALVAYNVGPTRFATTKSLKKPTPSYVKKVLNFKSLLEDKRIKTETS
jgi:soluble lytic murein transglycosylase